MQLNGIMRMMQMKSRTRCFRVDIKNGCLNAFLYAVVIWLRCCDAVNVDTEFPIVFRGDRGSYFGYSVALHKTSQGPVALISATRANSTYLQNSPGALYKCSLEDSRCLEIILEKDTSNRTEKMWLGVSLDVQPTEEGRVVTCGHLWKRYLPGPNFVTVNGVCYIINKELDKVWQTIRPLISGRMQFSYDTSSVRHHRYSVGQAGASVTFSKDGTNVILGAPGVYNGTGSVIRYDVGKTWDIFDPIPLKHRLISDSYIGYSVTTGEFFARGGNYIAAGAPRAANHKGKVYLFEMLNSYIELKDIGVEGSQVGEYFGASVLGVDLNNDGYTDLLVGAPFHTLSEGDEGKVYLYMSNGKSFDRTSLVGSKKPFARFGSSVASLGDINQDGFQDVAVGAPYEDDHGAVYIFQGTINGLKKNYVQRISGEDINAEFPLQGFGASIATAKDIDGNHYPDLLIGSFLSDGAVLLRSRPVVYVEPSLRFNISLINMDVKNCEHKGKPVTCLLVEHCLNFRGVNIPQEIGIIITLETDVKRNEYRSYFLTDDGSQTTSLTEKIQLNLTKSQTCGAKVAYIHDDVDILDRLQFSMAFKLDEDQDSRTKFCAECPVLDDSGNTNITEEISFQTDCGDDDVCHCNLTVTAQVEHLGPDNTIIVGQTESFSINIVMANTAGEPAYRPRLIIDLPGELDIVNSATCTSPDDEVSSRNKTLICRVAQPLFRGQKERFQIKLKLKASINATRQDIVINLRAVTDSDLIDPSSSNISLVLPISFEADITVEGYTQQDQVLFGEDVPETIFLTHTFVVRKYSPSPVDSVGIEISVPVKFPGTDEQFLQVEDIQLEDDGEHNFERTNCNMTQYQIEPPSLDVNKAEQQAQLQDGDGTWKQSGRTGDSMQTHLLGLLRDQQTGDSEALSCLTSFCAKITCESGPFKDSKKTANFRLSLAVSASKIFKQMNAKGSVYITSQAEVWIKDEDFGQQPDDHRPDFGTVTTALTKAKMSAKEVPSWIIILGICIGLLILILILAGLLRIGFFRRKKREQLRSLMQQAELHSSNSNSEGLL